MGTTLQIDNVELLASFERLSKALGRQVAVASLREGLSFTLGAIQSRITDRSGMLRRGLKVRQGKGDRPGRISVYISSVTTRKTFARVTGRRVGPGRPEGKYRVFYGPMVEYGHKSRVGYTVHRKTQSGKAVILGGREAQVKEHPFMRPGFDATVQTAAETIEQTLWEKIAAAQ